MMKPGLQLRVSQHLALTPQLQQSIRLLQLSTMELQQEIEGMLESNPFLEEDSAAAQEDFPLSNTDTPEYLASSSRESSDPKAEHADYAATDSSSAELGEMDWSQTGSTDSNINADDEWHTLDESDWGADASFSQPQDDDEDTTHKLEWVSESTSLTEHLMLQARTLRICEEDSAALTILIESLNENGYLADDLNTITDQLLYARQDTLEYELEHEDMLERLQCALHWLQAMDPPGIGARNLSECLVLQLKQLPQSEQKSLAVELCSHHLDLMAKRDHKKLAAATHATEEDIREAFQLILTLDPKPGRQFSSSSDAGIVPDVIIKKTKNQWKATLNPEVMPKIRVNDIYAQALRGHKGSDGAQALSQRLQEARWFIKNIQQRFDTILRVSQAIVDRQKNFFTHGEIAMRPLVLREIADELGLHESTISRVTTAKYMLTPFGIYELKFFFGSSLTTETGGNASSTAVRALLKQLIAEENPKKPLSDNDIVKLLSEQGIQVARRTVAKYREGLKIPPANLRKAV